jgi:hypothetical protein
VCLEGASRHSSRSTPSTHTIHSPPSSWDWTKCGPLAAGGVDRTRLVTRRPSGRGEWCRSLVQRPPRRRHRRRRTLCDAIAHARTHAQTQHAGMISAHVHHEHTDMLFCTRPQTWLGVGVTQLPRPQPSCGATGGPGRPPRAERACLFSKQQMRERERERERERRGERLSGHQTPREKAHAPGQTRASQAKTRHRRSLARR